VTKNKYTKETNLIIEWSKNPKTIALFNERYGSEANMKLAAAVVRMTECVKNPTIIHKGK